MRVLKISSLSKFLACLFFLHVLAACQAMQPLNTADAAHVDHLLILMEQRLDVAPLVARAKWNSGGPINDPPREQLILDAVTAQASGLDASFVRKFFQAQFDASKAVQQGLHVQWQQQGTGTLDNAPDLGKDVRPVLDRLTPELIATLREVEPLLAEPAARSYIEMRSRVLLRNDFGGLPRRLAIRGLFAD